MNKNTIMKDPFYAPILFEIESCILSCVRSAKAEGVEMNDSQIRSTLNKVRKTSEGGKPQIPDTSPRDKALVGLHGDLIKVRAGFIAEESDGTRKPLPTKEWTLCLRTIEDSIQRYATGSGSRGYQEFLEDFIPKNS